MSATPPSSSAACAACGGTSLREHMAVAGDPGPEGLAPSTTRYGTALSDIVRCINCGHMQLGRFPSEETLTQAYGDAESHDYLEEEAGQRATARTTLERIERYRRRGRILDIGCWLGFLLDEARERGWDATGVEPSTFASTHARERLGLDVRTAPLFGAKLEEGHFDAVVLGDVIEHLPDPGQALARIAAVSRPRAILYLTLPDAGSRVARAMGARWWSVIPTHLQYFTRHSMAVLLNRHGWQVLDVATAPKAFTVRYYLGRLGGYSPRAADALIRAAGRIGMVERIWAPDFRDRMAVVARAPG